MRSEDFGGGKTLFGRLLANLKEEEDRKQGKEPSNKQTDECYELLKDNNIALCNQKGEEIVSKEQLIGITFSLPLDFSKNRIELCLEEFYKQGIFVSRYPDLIPSKITNPSTYLYETYLLHETETASTPRSAGNSTLPYSPADGWDPDDIRCAIQLSLEGRQQHEEHEAGS